MRRIQLTVILIALLSVSAIASVNSEKTGNFQPGYIIAGGDTIKGFILMGDHISNIKECTFKETSTGHERTYSPDDLEGYGVDGKSFFLCCNYSNGVFDQSQGFFGVRCKKQS